jgi:hypothetical protein
MDEDFSQEELSPTQIIALWRHRKIDRSKLDRSQRSKIMRGLRAQVRHPSGGNPRATGRTPTVPHNPGPRGGCRCAACRKSGNSLDRGRKKLPLECPRIDDDALAGPPVPHQTQPIVLV